MNFLRRFAIYLALFTGLVVFVGVAIAVPAFIRQHFGEEWGFIMATVELVIFCATLLTAAASEV